MRKRGRKNHHKFSGKKDDFGPYGIKKEILAIDTCIFDHLADSLCQMMFHFFGNNRSFAYH